VTSKLGLCSLAALDRPLAAVARAASLAGCDGIEVTARPPHLDPEAGPAAARAAAREVRAAGLEVLAYGSYAGAGRPLRREDAERAAEIAAALEAPLVRVWAEERPGEGAAPVLAHLRELCDAAARFGQTVVVERHLGSLADTPERTLRLLAEVDRPNFALNYQVLDFLPVGAAADQPEDARRLAGRARYFHLKNYRPQPDGGGRLVHGASLEDGALDYRALLAAAFAAGYSGPLAIEFLAADARPLETRLGRDVAWLRGVLAELRAA
jgi:sugar phosphate isomerase/epimerase